MKILCETKDNGDAQCSDNVGDGEKKRAFKNVRAYWHNKCCERDRELGIQFRPCTHEYWEKCNAEFESLSEEQQMQEHIWLEPERQEQVNRHQQ